MADVLSPEQRSRCMAAIKHKNTKPEMVVRRITHSMGYRYRLHVRTLPGSPDLVFPRLKKVIFVHGCFWHMHFCQYGKVVPKTRAEFWAKKRRGNVERDAKYFKLLSDLGWKSKVIWECETKQPEKIARQIEDFLHPD